MFWYVLILFFAVTQSHLRSAVQLKKYVTLKLTSFLFIKLILFPGVLTKRLWHAWCADVAMAICYHVTVCPGKNMAANGHTSQSIEGTWFWSSRSQTVTSQEVVHVVQAIDTFFLFHCRDFLTSFPWQSTSMIQNHTQKHFHIGRCCQGDIICLSHYCWKTNTFYDVTVLWQTISDQQQSPL